MKKEGFENLRLRIIQNAEDDEDELLACWTTEHNHYKASDPDGTSYPAEEF